MFFKTYRISDEYAAGNIGKYFPEVRDKLLNILQLQKQATGNRPLIDAGIQYKSLQLSDIRFDQAINLKENFRYIRYLLAPFLIVVGFALIKPGIITEPTKRILHFNQEFIPQAPFQFDIQNRELLAFRNEDYKLDLELSGNSFPENVYLLTDGRRIKLNKQSDISYQHLFEKIQQPLSFRFEAAGFKSRLYELKIVNRPNIKTFHITLSFPPYLQRSIERINNIGNMEIPEGTRVKWLFSALDARDMSISFENEKLDKELVSAGDQLFEYEKQMLNSDDYIIRLSNVYSKNKDVIRYHIEVIPDAWPRINLDQFQDTTLYDLLILGGSISDDYGLTELKVFYKNERNNRKATDLFQPINIPIDQTKNSQSFYFQWEIDSLQLKMGDVLQYYLQVRDNDGLNGRKVTRTEIFTFKIPTGEEIRQELEKATRQAENQLDNNVEKARELKRMLEEAQDKLKGKKMLSWQDKQMLEELEKQKQELNDAIKKFKEQLETEEMKRDRFSEKRNEHIREMSEQLQKLMEELLDEETKQLYEELQKLLDEQKNMDKVKDLLNQLNRYENTTEKELERALDLFRKMKFENKLQQTIDQTKELEKAQNALADKTKDKKSQKEELLEEQKQLSEQFEELKKDMDEMRDLNQDLLRPKPLQDFSDEEKQIEEQQKQAQQELGKNKKNKAAQSQKAAGQALRQMAKKLSSMQSMMMQANMEMNLGLIRDLLDNLIKLSFAQEQLMKDFRQVHQSDPRFLQLSEKQLLLQEDAKVIEDSLHSIAKDNFMIQAFMTREVDEMNRYFEETVDAIRDRKKGEAVGKQQFVMTSINNLALMLDDVMTQMMNASGSGSGKGQDQSIPSLSELQKQLNKKISELKKSGKQGRELSEELANLAAEQERIRRMLQQLEEKLQNQNDGKGAGSLEEIRKKMEQTEIDLVNKQITRQLIQRQQEIVTRMLNAENAIKEREPDNEREAEHAKQYQRKIPKAFEDYIKMKEQEIELLKTVPLKLNPFYKKEVSEYFKRIESTIEK
ncbi:MAG: hypothetical protein DRH21_04320 [Deltaproteobacteria bacterium]|nr:MAG: hypothetical protein DRH21_04320 [Deltaproteobacteria bacterium]